MRISSPPYFSLSFVGTRRSVADAHLSAASATRDKFSVRFGLHSLIVMALCVLGTSIGHAADDHASNTAHVPDYAFNFTGIPGKPSTASKDGGFTNRTLFLPPHATLLPDTQASDLQIKIVEPSHVLAAPSDHAGLTPALSKPPLPSQNPQFVVQKRLAQRSTDTTAKTAILSEDSNSLAITKAATNAARNQVAAVPLTATDLVTLGETADEAVESPKADAAVGDKPEPTTAQIVEAQPNPQKTADVTAEHTPSKTGNIAAVPKPVMIQQETATTVILTSSQTTESGIPTVSRSDSVSGGASPAKPQIPISNADSNTGSDTGGYSISSDVETDIAMAATNEEIANPAVAPSAARPIEREQPQVAALSKPVDAVDQKATVQIVVPLPEAKPGREKLLRRAIARQKAQRRRAAARRRAALARAKAKAGQAQSQPTSLLPNWISSALQIAN